VFIGKPRVASPISHRLNSPKTQEKWRKSFLPAIATMGCLLTMAQLQGATAHAQDVAGLEQGLKPYGSYDGGNLDSVSMVNGGLSLQIPLVSYPQRGGKLNVSFSIGYNSPSLAPIGNEYCPSNGETNPICTATNVSYILENVAPTPNSTPNNFNPGVVILQDFIPAVNSNAHVMPGVTEPIFIDFMVVDPDGANHHLGQIGNGGYTNWLARDGTGYALNINTLTLTDRNGIRYLGTADPQTTFNGVPYGPVQCCMSITGMEDPNGNRVSGNYVPSTNPQDTPGTTYLVSWTDTMGRTIPLPPPLPNGSGSTALTSNYSGCTGSLPTTAAYEWNVPGPNGGTSQYKICYASMSYTADPTACANTRPQCAGANGVGSQIQSIVLPNLTTWTFVYNSAGLLEQMTLPTGGSISYTWNGATTGIQILSGYMSEYPTYHYSVASRTVTDNTGSHTWTYTYSGSPTNQTIVTDPLGNDTVHTITDLGTVEANLYETELDKWAGSHSGGTLLQTTKTTYNSAPDPYACGISTSPGCVMDVMPQLVKTTDVPSGKVTQTTKSYDLGVPVYSGGGPYVTLSSPMPNIIFGDVTGQNDYDFGSAGPGLLLRQIITKYMAISGPNASAYYANNLLALPYTEEVLNGAGTQVSLTQLNYDETAVASSGLSASPSFDTAPTTGSYRGNNTSVLRWLNIGTPNCPNGYSSGSSSILSRQTFFNTGLTDASVDPCGNTTTYAYSQTYQAALPTTITDPMGLSSTYSYDFNTGLKTSSKDPNLQTTSYGYDSSWRLSSVTYPDTGSTTYCYSDTSPSQCPGAVAAPSVLLTKSQTPNPEVQIELDVDGLGREIKQRTLSDSGGIDYVDTVYDAVGRPASKSNVYRSTSDSTYGLNTYSYDALNRPTVQTHPDLSTIGWAYNGNSTTETDEVGNAWIRTTDGLGRLTQVSEPGGIQTAYVYSALGDLLTVQQTGVSGDQPRARTFNYDSLSRLLWSQNPESGLVCYGQGNGTVSGCQANGYASNGNLIYKTDARGVTTNYSYDSLNHLVSKTYSGTGNAGTIAANTLPSAYSYGGASTNVTNGIERLITEFTGASGAPTTQRSIAAYDAMGRVKQETQCISAGCTTTPNSFSYSYDVAGNVTSSTNGSSSVPITLTYGYDGAARIETLTSSLTTYPTTLFGPPTSGTQYSAVGLIGAGLGSTSSSQPAFTLQRAYDDRLRVVSETNTGSSLVLNPAQASSGSIIVAGNEQSVTIPAAHATGQITITGADGTYQVCTSKPNPLPGKPPIITCVNDPDTGTFVVTIGSFSATATYGSGVSTDPQVASAVAAAINSGSGSPVTAAASNNVVTLTSIAMSATSDYPYSVTSAANFSGSDSGATLTGGAAGGTVYDSGIITATINGAVASYAWGSSDNFTSIANGLAAAINSADSSFQATYSGGTITVVSKQTGTSGNVSLSCSLTHNSTQFSTPSYQVTTCNGLTGGANEVVGPATVYSYSIPAPAPKVGYAANGNLLSVTDSAIGSWAYSYDGVNRLLTAQASANPGTGLDPYGTALLTWTYDSFGNYKGHTLSGNTSAMVNQAAYTYTGYSLLNGVSYNGTITNQMDGFNYDASGNLLSDKVTSYLYDAESRVASADGTTQYLYDAEGRRVAKLNGGTLTNQYLLALDGSQVSELNAQGNWLHTNAFVSGRLLATYDSVGLHFQFSDWLGTRRVQVNATTGVVDETCLSLPFGDSLSCNGTDATELHFTGKERDAESGLDYFGARYYGSSMGRFMSPDDFGGHLEDPQTLNKYAYAGNNPLRFTDPSGHDFWQSCQQQSATCGNQQIGTGTDGKPINQLVSGTTDSNGNFTATVVTSASLGQAGSGNTASVDGTGVHITTGTGTDSQQTGQGIFIAGTQAADIQGSGNGWNQFSFHIDSNDVAHGVLTSGTANYLGPGGHQGMLNTINGMMSGDNTGPFSYITDRFNPYHPGATNDRFTPGDYPELMNYGPSPHFPVPGAGTSVPNFHVDNGTGPSHVTCATIGKGCY